MPPHCDTMDGPVVKACRKAFETDNVNLVLPWVPESDEGEVREAFKRVQRVRKKWDSESNDIVELWFFETVVRLHRAGEDEPYTGLKPAGLDWGPVLPMTEKATVSGDPGEVIKLITGQVEHVLFERFMNMVNKGKFDPNDVHKAREYVHAELGFVLYAHKLWSYLESGGATLEHHV
ncbi:MAG: DUF6448 family protein [Euryarchaeota archaeon]|nr:DUF6448 family protein [Euryarchaeota archaeon]